MIALNVETAASEAELRKHAQRQRILKAALQCFEERGFHAASMAAIAEAAEMSPGLIYRYFDGKNAIIMAIIDSQLNVARRRICAIRNTDDLNSAIVDFIDSRKFEGHLAMSTPLFLEITADAVRDEDIASVVRRIDHAVRDQLTEWFRRPAEEGGLGFSADVARERVLALMILVDGLKFRLARDPKIDRKQVKRAVKTMVAAVIAE